MNYIVLALLSSFFAALVAIFGKIGLGKIDSTLATFLRSGVMFIFLLIFVLSTKKFSIDGINPKAWMWIIGSGIAGAVSWLFYFAALKAGDATKVSALDRTSIVFVLILAAIFLAETIKLKSVVGIILVVLGSILLVI